MYFVWAKGTVPAEQMAVIITLPISLTTIYAGGTVTMNRNFSGFNLAYNQLVAGSWMSTGAIAATGQAAAPTMVVLIGTI